MVIAANPELNAPGRLPPVLNAAMTTATTQAATITYSSDTTPSLSVLRRSNPSRVFDVMLQHIVIPSARCDIAELGHPATYLAQVFLFLMSK